VSQVVLVTRVYPKRAAVRCELLDIEQAQAMSLENLLDDEKAR
jgi:hypothetical protein